MNGDIRAKLASAAVMSDLTFAKEASVELTASIEGVDHAKAEAIGSAGLPVAGLGFDDLGVTLNGVPFSQSSAAERLRTSIAIAMAANPTIRVIRITDGSLLDSANLAVIEEMATAADFQIWIEKVDETGTVGFTVEDGALA